MRETPRERDFASKIGSHFSEALTLCNRPSSYVESSRHWRCPSLGQSGSAGRGAVLSGGLELMLLKPPPSFKVKSSLQDLGF